MTVNRGGSRAPRLRIAFLFSLFAAALGAQQNAPDAAQSAFVSWLPGVAASAWWEPDSGAWFVGGDLRIDLAYAVDRGGPPSSLARGRWERYLQAGAFASTTGGPLLALFTFGMNGSLESAGTLSRAWLVPYVGLDAGLAALGNSWGFAVVPTLGLALWSGPRFSCSIEVRALAAVLPGRVQYLVGGGLSVSYAF